MPPKKSPPARRPRSPRPIAAPAPAGATSSRSAWLIAGGLAVGVATPVAGYYGWKAIKKRRDQKRLKDASESTGTSSAEQAPRETWPEWGMRQVRKVWPEKKTKQSGDSSNQPTQPTQPTQPAGGTPPQETTKQQTTA